MKTRYLFLYIVLSALMLVSCTTPRYIHDLSSFERQKELRQTRSSNVFSSVFLGISSAGLSVAFNSDILLFPPDQQFKNLKLQNATIDTMYVNMLSDVYWDENDYCDFMDIRIPPLKSCKIMVPLDANYNLYFSTTPESDDDEMLEFNTNRIKNIALVPGMTLEDVANSRPEE